MYKFKFRYKNILNLLENKENQIKNNLGLVYSELHQEENKLKKLIDESATYSNLIKTNLEKGCKLHLLRNMESYKNILNSKIKHQNDRVIQKKEKANLIKSELVEILKEKKIMENIKEKDLTHYKEKLKSIEEKNIDQLVTYSNSIVNR